MKIIKIAFTTQEQHKQMQELKAQIEELKKLLKAEKITLAVVGKV
jgi:hypothetical protein